VSLTTLNPGAPPADFYDTDFYAGDPYPTYAWLRREAPVYWYEPGGFWVLSTYEDIRTVAARPELYSNEFGLTIAHQYLADRLPDPLPPEREAALGHDLPRKAELRRLVQLRGVADPEGFSLNPSDPPRHTRLRALLHRAFTPRVVAQLEPRIREITQKALDRIERGTVVDFVQALSFAVPSTVIAELVGVPDNDRANFMVWLQALMVAGDLYDEPGGEEFTRQVAAMHNWLRAQAEEHRLHPRDDLIGRLILANVGEDAVSAGTLLSAIVAVLGGGTDTMMNAIGGAARTLVEHPEQRAVLTKNPELIRGAVDELVRWVTPIISFTRTAKAETEIGEKMIARGDLLMLLYASANRDESVWPDPGRFDVTRNVDPSHLSFGYGEHNCLGRSLAQLELKIVFEELLQRFPRYELAGPVTRRPSIFMNTTDQMPVRFI
jgi:cytochrome P450